MSLYEEKKLKWREWSKNANSVKSALMRSLFNVYKKEDVAAQTGQEYPGVDHVCILNMIIDSLKKITN